jgi:acetyltransferase-like isoleucine patch superfamily enzyme
MKARRSIGNGVVDPKQFGKLGSGVVIEDGVRVFHPENVEICDDVYIGHDVILHGYYKGYIRIGKGSWIGPRSYLHGAGRIEVGDYVGIGPYVKILTSYHDLTHIGTPLIKAPLIFESVILQEGCDIGTGATVLPGVTIGRCAQIGAGAVVTEDIPANSVAVGIPAKVIRTRGEEKKGHL